MSYTFGQLAPNWNSLTNAEKEALFSGTNFNSATLAELQTLGEFKVLSYADSLSGSASSVKVKGVHNDFLVLPNQLFGSNFNKIKSINITEIISDTTNAKIRYAITKDLVDYYVLDNGTWTQINATASDFITDGMSASDIALISSSDWLNFYDGDYDEDGIGIAFAFHETAISQSTAIDALAMIVDMRGTWNKAEHTEDYTYGYTNDTLHVDLLKNGSYKINYGSSSGGGGSTVDLDYITDQEVDNLFI